jgi:YD repeat-containing protein
VSLNRSSEVLTSGSSTTNTYNYPSGNNLLSTITQASTTVRSFSYDGAGNVTADTIDEASVFAPRHQHTRI